MLTLNQMPNKLELGNPMHIKYRKAWEELSSAEIDMLCHLEDDRYSQFTVGWLHRDFTKSCFIRKQGSAASLRLLPL